MYEWWVRRRVLILLLGLLATFSHPITTFFFKPGL